MKYIQSVTLLCLSVLFSGCVVVASAPSRADFHQQETLVLDANALKGIDIVAGSGSMVVQGKEGLSEIHVTAE